MVTAGFANEVDVVNQYAATMYAAPARPSRCVTTPSLDIVRAPLPAPSAELHFIVVDPGGAGRWRIATADDVAALERSTTTWPPSP
jgi:hypothetical protein